MQPNAIGVGAMLARRISEGPEHPCDLKSVFVAFKAGNMCLKSIEKATRHQPATAALYMNFSFFSGFHGIWAEGRR